MDAWRKSGSKTAKSATATSPLPSQTWSSQSSHTTAGGGVPLSGSSQEPPSSRAQQSQSPDGERPPRDFHFQMRSSAEQDGSRWMTDQPAVRSAPGLGANKQHAPRAAAPAGTGASSSPRGSVRSAQLVSRSAALHAAKQQLIRDRAKSGAPLPSKSGGGSASPGPDKDSSVTCLVCHFTAQGRPASKARNAGQPRLSRAARTSLGKFKSVTLGRSTSTKAERRAPLHEGCIASCVNMGLRLDEDGVPHHVLRTLRKLKGLICSRCGCPGATVTASGTLHTESSLQPSPKGTAPKLYHVPCAIELKVSEQRLFGSAGSRGSASSASSSSSTRRLFQGGEGGVGSALSPTEAPAHVAAADDSTAAWVARRQFAEKKRAVQHAAGRSATAALLAEDGPALQLNRALKARAAAQATQRAAIAQALEDFVTAISPWLAHSGVQTALAQLEGVAKGLPLGRAQRILKAAAPAACIKSLAIKGGSVGAISASVGLPQVEALKLMSLQSALGRADGSEKDAAVPSVLPIPEHAYQDGTVPRPTGGIDLLSYPRAQLPAEVADGAVSAVKAMLQQLYDCAGMNKQSAVPESPAKTPASPARSPAHTRNTMANTPERAVPDARVHGTPSRVGQPAPPSKWDTPARGFLAQVPAAEPLAVLLGRFPEADMPPAAVLNSAKHPPPCSPEAPLSASQAEVAEEHDLFLNTDCGPAAVLDSNRPPPSHRILPPSKVRAPSDSDVATMPMAEEMGRLLQRLHPADARFPINSSCTERPAQRFRALLTASSHAALVLCSSMQHAAVKAAFPEDTGIAHALVSCTPPAPPLPWGGGTAPDSLPQELPLREALQALQARSEFVASVAGAGTTPPSQIAATPLAMHRWECLVTASRRNGLGPLGTALTSVSASSVAEFAEADSPSRAARTSVFSTPNSARARKQRQARLSLSFSADGATVLGGTPSTSQASQASQGSTPSALNTPLAGGATTAAAAGASTAPDGGGDSLEAFECWQEAAEEVGEFASLVDAWAAWVPLDCAVNAGTRQFVPAPTNPPTNAADALLRGIPDGKNSARVRTAVLAAACAPGVHPAALRSLLTQWSSDAANPCVASGESRGSAGTHSENSAQIGPQGASMQRVPPMSDAEVLATLTLTDAAAKRVEGARLASSGKAKPGRETVARKRLREARNDVVHRAVAKEVHVLEHAVAPSSALGAYVVGRDLRTLLVEWSTVSTGTCSALRQLIVDMHTLGKPPNKSVFRSATQLVRFVPSYLTLDASHRLLHGSASLFPSHVTHNTTVVASPATPLAMVFDMVMPLVPHLVFPEVFPVGLREAPSVFDGGCPGQAPTVLVGLDPAPAPSALAMDASHPSSGLMGLGDCSMHKLDLAVGRISFSAWGAGTLLRDATFWSQQYRRFAQETLMRYESQLDRLVESLQGSSSFGVGTAFCDASWLVVPPWAPHTRMYSAIRSADASMWGVFFPEDDAPDTEHSAAKVFGAFDTEPTVSLIRAKDWLGTYHCMKLQAMACALVDMICSVFREHAVPRWAPADENDPSGGALWQRLKHLNLQSMRVAGEWLGALGMVVPLSRSFVYAVARSIRALPSPLHENMLMSAWPQCPLKRSLQAALQAQPATAEHDSAPNVAASNAVLDISGGSSGVVNLAESQDDSSSAGDTAVGPAASGDSSSSHTIATWNAVAAAADDCSNIAASNGLQWHQMLKVALQACSSISTPSQAE